MNEGDESGEEGENARGFLKLKIDALIAAGL